MANSLRHDFHADLASLFADDIQYQHSRYYYYLGKVNSWGSQDVAPDLIQEDSELENMAIRSNIVYLKNITPNDISLVVTRYNWASGKVFATWDNTINMRGIEFYCVTSENGVYKCLNNNGNTPSTVEPSGNSFTTTHTIDGYVWKYMYTIPSFKDIRFSSLTNIPVQRSLTDSFYNKGSVDDVAVINSGSGYTNTPVTTLLVSGSTTGAGAAGTLLVGVTGNITGVNITNGGSGYTAGVDISFVSTAGTGGSGTAIIVAGEITGMTIDTPGVGYQAGDIISFTVGGGLVVPFISVVTGEIVSVKIIKSGAGYTSQPTITINTMGLTGSGKYSNPTALFSSIIHNGRIVQINIIDPGKDYSTDTSTTIVVTGDGVDAEFTPVIHNGSVIGVIVDNTGSSYTDIKLTVVGTGVGATLNPILSLSDFMSNQSIVEQTTIDGAIYNIKLTETGNNYSPSTTIVVTGDGENCTAAPVIVDGAITNITIITPGSGYTYSKIEFVDPLRAVSGNVDATAYAVLPPNGGHGFNAISELFARTLAINSSLRQDSELLSIYQDFRQFGILKEPVNISNNKKFALSSSMIVHVVEFDNVVGLVKDELLLLGGIKFRVISISGNNVTLQQLGIKYIDPIGVLVADIENTRQYASIKVIKYPDVNKYSGKLLYVSNESPFSFSEDQGIIIKTFLQF